MAALCFFGNRADDALQGSPVAGFILEANGGSGHGLGPYRPAMFYGGSLAFGSAVLIAIVRFRRERDLLAKS